MLIWTWARRRKVSDGPLINRTIYRLNTESEFGRVVSQQRTFSYSGSDPSALYFPETISTESLNQSSVHLEMTDFETEKPLRKISEAFKELAATVNSQSAIVEVASFSRACSLVSPLFGCLGIAFKFAEMDYVAKVSLLPFDYICFEFNVFDLALILILILILL